MRQALLVIAWLSITAGAFWHYQGRYLLPVQVGRPLRPLPTQPTVLAGTTGRTAVVLNFWNPTCGCSRFAESHVNDLAKRYAAQNVQFITVVTGGTGAEEDQRREAQRRGVPGLVLIDADQKLVKEFDILAAPAAVVFDASGKAVYRGSYNISRTCTDEATAYVAKALGNLTSGKPVGVPGLPFYGCSSALN